MESSDAVSCGRHAISRKRLTVLPSLLVLGAVALAARALAVAVGVQSIHFTEEAATGLHARLGPLFGLPAMPLSMFVAFNLTWIAIWVAAIPGVRSARAPALFAAWFLAIAGMVNGIAHPLLAVAAGGYFPGLISSPVIGSAGVWLWVRLRRATLPRTTPAR